MYGVFDSQFLPMKVAFAREGSDIEVAYKADGEPDYLYQPGRLLAVDDSVTLRRVGEVLQGVSRAPDEEQPAMPGLVILSIDSLAHGYLTVPQAMDVIDAEFGGDKRPRSGQEDVAPVHGLHVTSDGRLCAATEPEVPCCCGEEPAEPCPPCPPVAASGGEGVLIGMCDTGLLSSLDLSQVSWLAGVTGDLDPLGPVLPGGVLDIPKYAGHGTFGAGVARCRAPRAAVHVTRLFTKCGGEWEHVIAQRLTELAAGQFTQGRSPNLVNVSAGGYTRKNREPLSFRNFFQGHPGITLTAARAPTGGSGPGSATSATGWTCTRPARRWSTRSRPACTATRSRRGGRPGRPSTAWPGGAAPRFPRRSSPA